MERAVVLHVVRERIVGIGVGQFPPETCDQGCVGAPFGPGEAFEKPSDAARAARDGDTVRIAAGTWRGDVCVWPQNDLSILGAGADEFAEAKRAGCTAMVTGDASYHDFLDAQAAGVSLFAAGHYETEIVIVDALIKKLSAAFPEAEFIPSERQNPIKTVV